ncbi:MAG: hypothetical protein ACFFCZ_15135 [Promethearchaeota archaeon]
MQNMQLYKLGLSQQDVKKLLGHFESQELPLSPEETIMQFIKEENLSELVCAGLEETSAASVIMNHLFGEKGNLLESFFRTKASIDLYQEVLAKISSFSKTKYAKEKLKLWVPLPSKEYERILERQNYSRRATDLTKQLIPELKRIDPLMEKLAPLSPVVGRIDAGSRVIVLTNQKLYDSLQKTPIKQFCDIEFLEDIQQLPGLTQDYNEVIVLSDLDIDFEGAGVNITALPEKQHDLESLVPEVIISFYAKNKEILESISHLSRILKNREHNLLQELFQEVDLESLSKLEVLLDQIKATGDINEAIDGSLNRLVSALNSMDDLISETERDVTDTLTNQIQEQSIDIKGDQLMRIIRTDKGETPELKTHLDASLFNLVEETLLKAEQLITEKLKLEDEEVDLLEGIFPREVTLPLRAIDERQKLLELHLIKKMKTRQFELKCEAARKLRQYTDLCHVAIKSYLEFDFVLTLGKFFHNYCLSFPKLTVEKIGIGFTNGLNLRLLQSGELKESSLIPVSYSIGTIGLRPPEVKEERIVLLSGANSGGKTTLILTISFFTILAQIGLGVPADEFELGIFDSMHFFEKSKGIAGAGAFESTLKDFSTMLLESDRRTLVLADEMESISEPGASARVISAFLDLLNSMPETVGVFVSHLANEIQKVIFSTVRVDGIEARGLDENLELIVDRSPKYYHYARSTPQLIVQRLFKLSEGKEQNIYNEVLSRFQNEELELDFSNQLRRISTITDELTPTTVELSEPAPIRRQEPTKMEKASLRANVQEILSVYISLLETVFEAKPHAKILLLLHGEKKDWTRQELNKAIPVAPAVILRSIHELQRAGLLEYSQRTEKIILKQRIY